jgi:pyruvate/2-oxoglutarate dehydrogenase complex dihydrolipoamide acyltransferase (E2) component
MAVQPVIMPKLGAYTEDVLLTEWLVGEGEEVAAGAAVFELETDKTTAEVQAETAGWVHRLVAAGDTVPIGASVGLIAESREEYEALAAGGPAAAEADADDGNPFLGYIGHGGGSAVVQAAGAAPATVDDDGRAPGRLRRRRREPTSHASRRAPARCSCRSASRSTTRARSSRRDPAAASSTAT